MAGFKDILGNENILEHFSKAMENDKISHAYIINGERAWVKRHWQKPLP